MNKGKRLGFVTIGQAPRDDMVLGIMEIINKLHPERRIEVTQDGALDDLSTAEIEELAPLKEERVLVTKLAGGEVVQVSEARLEPYMQHAVERASARAELVVLLCTGSFACLRSHVPLIHPDRLLLDFCFSALTEGVLGVIVPDQSQIEQRGQLWRRIRSARAAQVELKFTAASPYTADGAVEDAAAFLADCNLLALDCMGYSAVAKQRAAAAQKSPVVLARSVVALAVSELI